MSANENAKFGAGAKKPSVAEIPPISILHLGEVMTGGAEKYGPFNWREGGVDVRTYYNAAQRHLLSMWDGEWADKESGQPHAAHIMACMAIILDAESISVLEQNGPSVKGISGDYIARSVAK